MWILALNDVFVILVVIVSMIQYSLPDYIMMGDDDDDDDDDPISQRHNLPPTKRQDCQQQHGCRSFTALHVCMRTKQLPPGSYIALDVYRLIKGVN